MATNRRALKDSDIAQLDKQQSGATGSFLTDADIARQTPVSQMLVKNLKEAGHQTFGAAKNYANVGGFGIPEIVSQKVFGKKFVPEDLEPQYRAGTEALGYLTGPAALAKGTSALGAKVLPSQALLPTMIKGGTTGAAVYGSQLPSPEEAETLQKSLNIIGKRTGTGFVVGAIFAGLGHTVNKIRGYARNKVLSIRKGYREKYAPEEYKAYDKGIRELPSEKLKGAQVIENLERKLVQRQLMNPDGTFNKPLSSQDSKLLRSYEKIYRRWVASKDGVLNSKDIIDEYQLLKGKYAPKPSPQQSLNREVADDFLNSAKDQFQSGKFAKINARYSDFKNKEAILDKYFKVKGYVNPLETAKGERFITQRLSGSGEAEQARKVVQDTTGQGLTGGIVSTKISQAAKSPLLRWALLGAAGGATFAGSRRE